MTAPAIATARPNSSSGFEVGLLRSVEVLAALILVVEIGVLFAGVVARYALSMPLTWSDKLASIL